MFPHSLFFCCCWVGLVSGGKGVLLFWFFGFQAQIADIHTTKGFHGYSAVSVGCWSQRNYDFRFLLMEATGKANTGILGFQVTATE